MPDARQNAAGPRDGSATTSGAADARAQDAPARLDALPWQAPRKGRLQTFVARLCETGRLMVGVPNYDVYRAHMAATHPDKPAMTYAEFFDNRQKARYGGSMSRCC